MPYEESLFSFKIELAHKETLFSLKIEVAYKKTLFSLDIEMAYKETFFFTLNSTIMLTYLSTTLISNIRIKTIGRCKRSDFKKNVFCKTIEKRN